MIRRMITALSAAVLILASSGCASVATGIFLAAIWDEQSTPSQPSSYTVAPYSGVTDIRIVKVSPGASQHISGSSSASVGIAVSCLPTRNGPYAGVCLGRDPSTIIPESCSWTLVRCSAAAIDLSPRMPRLDTAPLFRTSEYVTAVLIDGPLMNTVAPTAAEVPLDSLQSRRLARRTAAVTWHWK